MNTSVRLPLQESMAQSGAGKHDQWRVYITILVVNNETIKSIYILTAIIHLMIKFHGDKLLDCLCQEIN